jgi:hypothetical protein
MLTKDPPQRASCVTLLADPWVTNHGALSYSEEELRADAVRVSRTDIASSITPLTLKLVRAVNRAKAINTFRRNSLEPTTQP